MKKSFGSGNIQEVNGDDIIVSFQSGENIKLSVDASIKKEKAL